MRGSRLYKIVVVVRYFQTNKTYNLYRKKNQSFEIDLHSPHRVKNYYGQNRI